MCLKFNSCSELFNAICKYFNSRLLIVIETAPAYARLLKCVNNMKHIFLL